MDGVNEYKERNNVNLSNITLINKSRLPYYNVKEVSNGKFTTYGPLVSRNMKTKMSEEANKAASKAKNNMIKMRKRMIKYDESNVPRAAAEARVRYWENHTPLGSPQWKRNALKNSRNALAALTPQKKGWFSGGNHRKTHKRKTNKRNKTKRNRN